MSLEARDLTPFPRRFRRRIAFLFVGACATSAGALAVGAFALSWTYRWDRFESRASESAATAAALVGDVVRPLGIPQIVAVFQELGFGEVVAISGDASFSSLQELSRDAVPDGFRSTPAAGAATYAEHGGRRYRIIAHPVAESDTTLYFFFATARLASSLRELALILAIGWSAVTFGAVLVGTVAARRVLSPVRRAAGAAHAVAEGMLDTRLPVSGSDEFALWAISFNEMAEALQAKLVELSSAHERERRFTGNVAHELMTPIGALVTEASVLEALLDQMPTESRRMVELVVFDIRRLRRLAEELLELARLDAASAVERLQPVVLLDVINVVVSAVEEDGEVDVDVEGGLVVCSDRSCLERILTNLLANALRHGEPPVRVSTESVGTSVVVHVDDNGPGLSEQDRERVFDRFYKSDASRSGVGAGLGLAIVRETSRLVGATVHASEAPAGGARFSVCLSTRAEDGRSRRGVVTES